MPSLPQRLQVCATISDYFDILDRNLKEIPASASGKLGSQECSSPHSVRNKVSHSSLFFCGSNIPLGPKQCAPPFEAFSFQVLRNSLPAKDGLWTCCIYQGICYPSPSQNNRWKLREWYPYWKMGAGKPVWLWGNHCLETSAVSEMTGCIAPVFA